MGSETLTFSPFLKGADYVNNSGIYFVLFVRTLAARGRKSTASQRVNCAGFYRKFDAGRELAFENLENSSTPFATH